MPVGVRPDLRRRSVKSGPTAAGVGHTTSVGGGGIIEAASKQKTIDDADESTTTSTSQSPSQQQQGYRNSIPCPITISFESLGLRLSNGIEVLKGVSGEFGHSKLTALMGPSGAGSQYITCTHTHTFKPHICATLMPVSSVRGRLCSLAASGDAAATCVLWVPSFSKQKKKNKEAENSVAPHSRSISSSTAMRTRRPHSAYA